MRGSCLQLAYKVPVLGSQDLPGSQRAKTERLGPPPPGHGAARPGSGRLSRCPALPGSPRAVALGRSSFSADRKCVAFLPAPGGPRPGASGRCRRWLCRMRAAFLTAFTFRKHSSSLFPLLFSFFFYPFFPLLIEAVTQTRSSLVLLLLVFMSLLSPLALRVLLVICLWF